MSPTRTLFAAIAAAFLAASASADIIAVRFKDPKVANRFKDNLVMRGGEQMVVGEQYTSAGGVALGTGGMPASDKKPIEVIIADSGDPTNVSYKIEVDKDGKQKLVFAKKKLIAIEQDDTLGVVLLMKDGTLATLAADYKDRKREIDALLASRDAQAKGSAEWTAFHRQALLGMERLESWLRSTLYPDAADKLAKEIAKQRKTVTAEAAASRKATALASIKQVPTPQALIDAAKEISGGTDKYSIMESEHARIIYREGIPDARVNALLTLTEEMIDGFRVECVDPYLDENFPDYIPDRQFVEWFFGYDDVNKLDRYWTDYLGQRWDSHKEERLKDAGHPFRRSSEPEFGHYIKTDDKVNLEGMVAHTLGHVLAAVHFDKKRLDSSQDWLDEGLALYLSLEWLGGNTVTCKAFHDPVKDDYGRVKNEKKAGEITVELGLRDYYNALAVEKGPRVDKLALKTTYEFEDADLAKSWSFVDYIQKKAGRQGQQFLRDCCAASHKPATFINDWRTKSEELFDVKGKDVFAAIEEQWKAFALVGQDTGDTRKK